MKKNWIKPSDLKNPLVASKQNPEAKKSQTLTNKAVSPAAANRSKTTTPNPMPMKIINDV